MGRKFTFTVKEQDRDQPCFLLEEDHGVMVALQPPSDYEHARRVADFLNQNVTDIQVATGTLVIGSSKIGGNWASLFDADGGTEVGNG